MGQKQRQLATAAAAIALWLAAFLSVSYFHVSPAAVFALIGLVITFYFQGAVQKLEDRTADLEEQLRLLTQGRAQDRFGS